MSNPILTDTKDRMERAIGVFQNNLSKLRTGRASLTMLDGIRVDYYGTLAPLNQVASLGTPEPRLITIQPWEPTMIPVIEKAIEKANIGVNPNSDGKIIRLPIPQLTEERRKELVKQLKAYAEECRVTIRQIRKEANEVLKKQQKDGHITEDDLKRDTDAVQKNTDEYTKKVDTICTNKEKDVMTV
jgi:ribosome recycling factor